MPLLWAGLRQLQGGVTDANLSYSFRKTEIRSFDQAYNQAQKRTLRTRHQQMTIGLSSSQRNRLGSRSLSRPKAGMNLQAARAHLLRHWEGIRQRPRIAKVLW